MTWSASGFFRRKSAALSASSANNATYFSPCFTCVCISGKFRLKISSSFPPSNSPTKVGSPAIAAISSIRDDFSLPAESNSSSFKTIDVLAIGSENKKRWSSPDLLSHVSPSALITASSPAYIAMPFSVSNRASPSA